MSEETEFVRGFKKGVDSILRKNPSGCCCKFNEHDEIIELCAAHKEYFSKLTKVDNASIKPVIQLRMTEYICPVCHIKGCLYPHDLRHG